MWDVRVCAACLATNVRMYSMSATSLLEPYQLLTGIEVQSEGMPQKLCWECAALVHKFNMFRHKCERASLLLQHLYNQHDEVSEEDVLKVSREQYDLISSYNICQIQVHNLESGTKSKKCRIGKTSEAEKNNESQTENAPIEPFIKFEMEIIKKEEVPIEMKFESNDTELIDDTFVEEDSSQMQLEPPRKKKCVTKKKQPTKQKLREKIKPRDVGMTEELLSQEQQMELMREKQNTEAFKTARFPCTLCGNYFNEERTFNNHMLKHDRVRGDLTCDLCKFRFKLRVRLVRHIHALHMKRYSCQSCPSVFYSWPLAQKHYAWHKGVKYTCRICSASYDNVSTYQSHLRIKHSSDHVCNQCGEPFHSKKGLICHINLSHKRDTVASGGEQETSGPYCAECDIQFTCKQAWTRHILLSPKHQHERHICALGCEACGEMLPDENSLRAHRVIHRRTPRTKPIIYKQRNTRSRAEPKTSDSYCAECDIQFKGKQAWTRHILISPKHQHERHICALGCKTCGETLPDEESLRAHHATYHGTSVKCEQCDEVLETHRAYHMHFRRAHPDKTRTHYPAMRAPLMCEICGRIFQVMTHLKEHSYKHTGERPFKCEVCNKTFMKSWFLRKHMRVHTKELLYKCNICDRRFSTSGNANRHESVHTDATPYACEICGKCFKYRVTVKTHIEYVHMKKPWPKRNRSNRQYNKRQSSNDKCKKLNGA